MKKMILAAMSFMSAQAMAEATYDSDYSYSCIGSRPDSTIGLKYDQTAAYLGSSKAKFALGCLYHYGCIGLKIPQDDWKAKEYWDGIQDSAYRSSVMFERGEVELRRLNEQGIGWNYEKWNETDNWHVYESAALLGNVGAMCKLANWYYDEPNRAGTLFNFNEERERQNYTEMMKWYKEARNNHLNQVRQGVSPDVTGFRLCPDSLANISYDEWKKSIENHARAEKEIWLRNVKEACNNDRHKLFDACLKGDDFSCGQLRSWPKC